MGLLNKLRTPRKLFGKKNVFNIVFIIYEENYRNVFINFLINILYYNYNKTILFISLLVKVVLK